MEKQIWDFLKAEGFNEYGVAGLMGNLYAESSLKPTNMQNSYESKLGYNDDSYTKAVDNGTYTNFIKDAVGYGLAQWTYWSRKQNLLNYAKSKNKSIGDLNMQLEFLVKELKESYTASVYQILKEATSVLEASNAVLLKFERPANSGESVQKTREKYGLNFYNKYAKTNLRQESDEMSVLIGHSSIDENGRISGGNAGDQTGKEICKREWYNKSWNVLLRCTDPIMAEKMAIACEQGCENNKIGYDQNQRNTLYTQAQKVNFDLSKITTACECDCSSFMCVCAIAAGVPADYLYNNNMKTTSTMRNAFLKSGKFEALTDSKYLTSDSYLKRGDILIKEGSHTVMVLSNGSKIEETPNISIQAPAITNIIGTAISKASLNIRTGPSTTYKSIGTISVRTTVQVVEITDNNWYKIIWKNSSTGYAYVSNASNKYFDYTPMSNQEIKVDKTEEFKAYKVKITASSLYVRTGPGKLNTARTTVKLDQIHTIIEEAKSNDGKIWGLLEQYKSNRDGWISLAYTKKI